MKEAESTAKWRKLASPFIPVLYTWNRLHGFKVEVDATLTESVPAWSMTRDGFDQSVFNVGWIYGKGNPQFPLITLCVSGTSEAPCFAMLNLRNIYNCLICIRYFITRCIRAISQGFSPVICRRA